MSNDRRWDPCVAHRGDEAERFLCHYFGEPGRTPFLVTGAGFDPRSCFVATELSATAAATRALLIRERRPNPPADQLNRAEANTDALVTRLTERHVQFDVKGVDVFGPDGAVVGGRNMIKLLQSQDLSAVTDIVVDIGSLSAGISFPAVRYFVQYAERCRGSKNLHVVVAHDPQLDAAIRSVDSDAPDYVHGFRGRSNLWETEEAARLWLPELATGRRAALERLYGSTQE